VSKVRARQVLFFQSLHTLPLVGNALCAALQRHSAQHLSKGTSAAQQFKTSAAQTVSAAQQGSGR